MIEYLIFNLIVISGYIYSPSGHETAKGFRSCESSCHLSATHVGLFTLSHLMLNVKQRSCEYQFLLYLGWFDQESNYHFSCSRSTHSTTDRLMRFSVVGKNVESQRFSDEHQTPSKIVISVHSMQLEVVNCEFPLQVCLMNLLQLQSRKIASCFNYL